MLLALIVHDADGIFECFVGNSYSEILEQVKNSKWLKAILERLNGYDEEEEEITEENLTMDHVESLKHDGDSEEGYTLIETYKHDKRTY